MEFLDEDARPRFLFQSRPQPSSSLTQTEPHQKPFNKVWLLVSLPISSFLFFLSIFFLENEPFKSLFFWVSLSILIGPFAPSSLTGGDVRVGRGRIVEFHDEEPEIEPETKRKATQKRSKAVRSEDLRVNPLPIIENGNGSASKEKKIEVLGNRENGLAANEQEKEWIEEDIEILKKQLVKNPVGKPRRWEVIAEAFKGRHRVESVIKKAKELGEKKLDDGDSYAQFLKNRKPLDMRIHGANEGLTENGDSRKEEGGGGVVWSSPEDIALLNALKAFPKDVVMRWEKIAAAVPGKSKAACMKRVAELKKDFRSSKAGAER